MTELTCVGTAGGQRIHLEDATEQALCGLRFERGPVIGWFELSACKRCVAAALQLGYVEVVDPAGDAIRLDTISPI